MKIDILCNDGSPIGVLWSDIHSERGVGGAELALLSLSEEFVKRGHDVSVFNNPTRPHDTRSEAGIKFKPLSEFDQEERDRVLVVFRSPNDLSKNAKGRKLWWSTDQYTVGSFALFAETVEKIVTISKRHSEFFCQSYGIDSSKIVGIDLGVRDEYIGKTEKIRNRLIFCSVPDRGLQILHAAWPLIRDHVPDASLVVTSDYRLWGLDVPNNHYHRLMWAEHPNVEFLGRITRSELVRHQKLAEIHAYPCIYDELFCLSVAECQVAGAYPVTSVLGALPTTNQWGTLIDGIPTSPEFVEAFVAEIIHLFKDDRSDLETRRRIMMAGARERFSWPRIAEQWEKLF